MVAGYRMQSSWCKHVSVCLLAFWLSSAINGCLASLLRLYPTVHSIVLANLTCSLKGHSDEIRMAGYFEVSRQHQGIPFRETTFSLRSGEGRADYKTDYRAAGRSWTTLDDVPRIIVDSRAN